MSNDIADRLEQIRERTEAATEGPWEPDCYVTGSGDEIAGVTLFQDARWGGDRSIYMNRHANEEDRQNADFIAFARSDVPFLLSLVEEYRHALRMIRDNEAAWVLEADDLSEKHMWETLEDIHDLADDALRNAGEG